MHNFTDSNFLLKTENKICKISCQETLLNVIMTFQRMKSIYESSVKEGSHMDCCNTKCQADVRERGNFDPRPSDILTFTTKLKYKDT